MERLTSKKGPKAIGAYSVATKIGNLIYTSGQLGMNPDTNKLVENNIKKQTHQAMENLKAILEEHNSGLENIIKATIYLDDIKNFKDFNQAYAEFFEENQYPSRTAIEVAALPLDAKVEIEVMAVVNEK